jgi:hypothetical protein
MILAAATAQARIEWKNEAQAVWNGVTKLKH